MARLSLACVVVLASLTATASADDYTWINPADGNWNTSTNWSGNVIPGAADSATLGTLANPYTVSLTDSRSINNLIIDYAGATLYQTGTLTVSGAFNLNAGSYNLSGTLINNGTMTSAAGTTFTWNGGNIGGTGTVTLSGNALFDSAGDLHLDGNGTTVVIGGTTTFRSGTIRLRRDADNAQRILRVAVGGVLDATETTAISYTTPGSGPLGLVDVRGTLRKSGIGTLTLTDGVHFNFAGESTIDVAANTQIVLNGSAGPAGLATINGTVTTTGAGRFVFAGGQLAPVGSATLAGNGFLWSGGSIVGNPGETLTLSGNATFDGPGFLELASNGGTLAIGGTTTFRTGTLRLLNQTGVGRNTLRVNPGGVLDATETVAVGASGNNGGAVGLVDVRGTLRKSGIGTLTLNNGVNYSFAGGSAIDVSVDSQIVVLGPASVTGTVTTTGAGGFNLAGGSLAPVGSATLAGNGFLWSGGMITGGSTDTLTLGGSATFDAAGDLNLSGNGTTLVIAGTTTFRSGTLRLWRDADNAQRVLRVAAGGVLDATETTAVSFTTSGSGPLGLMDVLGTLRKSGIGTLTLDDGVVYDISGTTEVTSGGMVFAGSTNLLSHTGTTLTKGTWLVSNGTLDFNGRQVQTIGANATVAMNGSATFSALNSLTQNNGTLRILGGHTFTPTAATVNTAGLIEVGTGSTFAKGIVVQNNGVLRGGGAVTGNVTAESGGTIAPGTPTTTGNLTVNGNFALQSGSTLTLKLNGTTAGTSHDRLTVNGTVDLGDATLLGNVGYSATTGDKLFILVSDGTDPITGMFNGLPDGSQVTLGDYLANLSYFGDSNTLALTGGNDLVLYNFTPVPEPGSALLAATLSMLLGGVYRRIRRTRSPDTLRG